MALRLQALPPLEEWSVAEVCDWLEVLGLEQYQQQFRTEGITGEVLAKLSQQTLRSDLGLSLGDATLLAHELGSQQKVSSSKRIERKPVMRMKGVYGSSTPLTPRTRKRVREFAGDGTRRAEPLTDEELECWDYQASWLTCAVTGASWPRSQEALIGMALYHQPRFLSPQEFKRRQLEEQHAARRKQEAAHERSGGDVVEPSVPEVSVVDAAMLASENGWEVLEEDVLPAQLVSQKEQEEDEDLIPGAGRNNKGEVGVGSEYDREFQVYPDVEPPPQRNMVAIPQGGLETLGFIEVMVGPVFERKAFNMGASGDGGTLGLADRGVVCLDRQYNAVNFQFFVQRHPNSFARKLCTSRISFYIEEGHGKRVFPRNILTQLSLLFYRANNKLQNEVSGEYYQDRVAECIMRAIPNILLSTALEVVQGTGFKQYAEHAIRLYLIVHHTAIKLLAFFPQAHQLVYDKVKLWIQNPFSPDALWGAEEAMLAASLVSVPFALLREALVRRILLDMQGGQGAGCAVLLKQNLGFLERLSFVQSFFDAGPGRLKLSELETRYTRCAGTLPCAEREKLLKAVQEASIDSVEDWWRTFGMDNIFSDDQHCATNILALRDHVLRNVSEWRHALRPAGRLSSTQKHALGAEELGDAAQLGRHASVPKSVLRQQRRKHEADLDASKSAMHEGYPTLKNGKLADHICLYCGETFKSRGALFRHLDKWIKPPRMVHGWHQDHFRASASPVLFEGSGPFRCPAVCCQQIAFKSVEELRSHMVLMGVPDAESNVKSNTVQDVQPVGMVTQSSSSVVPDILDPTSLPDTCESAAVNPYSTLGVCSSCTSPRNIVFTHCGHCIACHSCAGAMKVCPVCSQTIVQRINVCWS